MLEVFNRVDSVRVEPKACKYRERVIANPMKRKKAGASRIDSAKRL